MAAMTFDITQQTLVFDTNAIGPAGPDVDAATIKTRYESNADTNAFTDAEKTKLGNQSGTNTGDQDLSGLQPLATVLTNTTAAFTTAQQANLANQSGTNTGDQDLSGLQPLAAALTATTAAFTTEQEAKLASVSPSASTIAVLKAYDTSTVKTAWLLADGNFGLFRFEDGDFDDEITTDTSERWFIKANDTDADEGAWCRVREIEGEWNIRDGGAVGDGVTDDRAAILYCIEMAQSLSWHGTIVKVPAKYNGRTEGTKWFYCSNFIQFEGDAIRISGDGRNQSKLLFGNHSTGVIITNTGSTQNIYNCLERMWIKGSAPSATADDAQATYGVIAREFSKSMLRDLYIEDFVDGIYADADFASSTTSGMIDLEMNNVYIDQNAWPNQHNKFPRYGMRFTNSNGTTFKMQVLKMNNSTIYSQVTIKTGVYSGDASTTTFSLNVGSGTFGLSQEAGIQVFVFESGVWVRKAITTDYTLNDRTGGGTTAIAAGASAKDGNMPSTNGYAITDVDVVFVTAPATGSSNIRITRVDPYGEVGLYMEYGDANHVVGGAIGGYKHAVQLGKSGTDAGANTIELDYIQLCWVGLRAYQGDNIGGKFVVRRYAESDILKFSELGTATGIIIDDLAGSKEIESELISDVALTGSYADILTWDVPNYRPGTTRRIDTNLTFQMTETSTTRVAFDLKLEYSNDGGLTWSTLMFERPELDITGATGNKFFTRIPFSKRHKVTVDNVSNVTRTLKYRIQSKLVSGDTITIKGSSTYESSGSIRYINP